MITPLGRIARVSTGFPFRRKVDPEPGGDVALVQIGEKEGVNVVAGTGPVRLRNEGGRFDRYLLQAGDLLFQSRGSRYPVAVVEPGTRCIAAAGLHVIRPDRAQVLPEYLAWWLNRPASQAKFSAQLARGSHVPFVSKADLDAFEVPLPSLDRQSRILEVERLRRQEQELATRIMQLTRQLVDGATLAAAKRNY